MIISLDGGTILTTVTGLFERSERDDLNHEEMSTANLNESVLVALLFLINLKQAYEEIRRAVDRHKQCSVGPSQSASDRFVASFRFRILNHRNFILHQHSSLLPCIFKHNKHAKVMQ